MSADTRLRPYRVRLSCGHCIRLRDFPLPRSRFACPARLGCGYQLAWTEWRGDGSDRITTNPKGTS